MASQYLPFKFTKVPDVRTTQAHIVMTNERLRGFCLYVCECECVCVYVCVRACVCVHACVRGFVFG